MNQSKLLSWYGAAICLILALIVVHAPLIVGLGTLFPHDALVIKAWKEIIMILLLLPAVWLLVQTERREKWTRDRLFWLIVAYVILSLVSLVQWHGGKVAVAGLSIDLRFLAFFALTYILVRLKPAWQPLLLRVATIGAVVVTGFAVIQLFLPHDFLKILGYSVDTIAPYDTIDRNRAFVREISTLRGPNPLGAYAMAVLVIIFAFVGRGLYQEKADKWKIGLLTLCATVALYVSFSRSAYLGLGVALLVAGVARWGRIKRFWYILGAIAAGCLAVVAGVMAVHPTYISNVFLHTNPNHHAAINSDTQHAASLIGGTKLILAHPFGAGIGSSGSASLLGSSPLIIENQYLQVAYEIGWLGLALFVAIYAIVLTRLWRRREDPWALGVFAAGIGLGVIGFLLPVWADDTVSIVWWGLAAIAIAERKGVRHGKRSTKQKTARVA